MYIPGERTQTNTNPDGTGIQNTGNQVFHMVTRGGANGRVPNPPPTGSKCSDCAVWLPGFSDQTGNGWIVLEPITEGVLERVLVIPIMKDGDMKVITKTSMISL